jgi:hypothetical protein
MSEWYEIKYPRAAKAAYAGKMPRPLYPPDAGEVGKRPSKDGPDIVAVKRAVKRGQRWAVDQSFESLDDSYSNRFSHGDGSGNVGGSGIEGFQRQQQLDVTGWMGQPTFDSLNWSLVPTGPNKGQPLFDDYAVTLLEEAWVRYQGKEPEPPPPEPSKTPEERVREKITEFCQRAIGEPDWYYSQNRAVDISVNPDGSNTSDCSGSAIQCFQFAKRETGLNVPDPAMQNWSGYGNTSYYEDDHPKCGAPYKVGDLAHYSGHVTVCYRAGDAQTADWFSFGSEPPSSRKLYYRDDFRFVVRPPLVK